MIMDEIFRMEDNGEQTLIEPLKDDSGNYDGKNYQIIKYIIDIKCNIFLKHSPFFFCRRHY